MRKQSLHVKRKQIAHVHIHMSPIARTAASGISLKVL